MSLTQITRTVVSSISSFFNINNTTGALTSVIPDLMPSNSTLFPSFVCRAWVNFDGTKDTTGSSSTSNTNRLIRGSGNITSVLRNGTGDYTITFTVPMPDVNYMLLTTGSNAAEGQGAFTPENRGRTKSVSQCHILCYAANFSTLTDQNTVYIAILR